MVKENILEICKNKQNPDLETAIEMYTKYARFCQLDPKNSHLSVIYKLRDSFEEECNYFEIGCLFGFSMVNAIKSKTPGKFVGIDLFETTGKIAMNDYTPDVVDRNLSLKKTQWLVNQNNDHSHKVDFIRGNSQSDSVFQQVLLSSSVFHIMFIDGDHSYKGTLNDYKKYSSLLASGGFLLFDDQDYPEISRVIHEIKAEGGFEWIPWEGYGSKFRGFFQKK